MSRCLQAAVVLIQHSDWESETVFGLMAVMFAYALLSACKRSRKEVRSGWGHDSAPM
jgi:hypothetical protein